MLARLAPGPAVLALALGLPLGLMESGCRSDGTKPPVHGSLATRYQGRWTDGAHDNDLTEVATLEVGDPKKDKVTGFLLAEGLGDLDGGSGGSSEFHSLADTFDGSVTARLFYAYADVHTVEELPTLRLGRQSIVETPLVAYFDGVRAETKELGRARTRIGAYGGLPVEIFAPSTDGQSMLGLFGETRPWKGGRLRGDWMHVEDEGLLGPRNDDLLGLGGAQSFGTRFRLDARHTRLEEEPRDVRVRGSWYEADDDLVVQASWYRLLEAQKDLSVPFDPFYATLFDRFPYTQVGLLASKGLGKHFDVQAGADVRRVTDEDDVGTFNRDFDRWFATTGMRGVLPAGLDLSLTGEVWDGDGGDIRTYGADLSRKMGADVEAAVGTYYSLYKYDLFQERELDHVRTWYLKLLWRRSVKTSFDARYEYEDEDFGEYHALRLGATWRF